MYVLGLDSKFYNVGKANERMLVPSVWIIVRTKGTELCHVSDARARESFDNR